MWLYNWDRYTVIIKIQFMHYLLFISVGSKNALDILNRSKHNYPIGFEIFYRKILSKVSSWSVCYTILQIFNFSSNWVKTSVTQEGWGFNLLCLHIFQTCFNTLNRSKPRLLERLWNILQNDFPLTIVYSSFFTTHQTCKDMVPTKSHVVNSSKG